MSQDKCADRPRHIANAIGCQGGDDGDGGIAGGKEYFRKNQRGCRGIDKEVVVFERRADPSTGCGLPGLMLAVGFVIRGIGHFSVSPGHARSQSSEILKSWPTIVTRRVPSATGFCGLFTSEPVPSGGRIDFTNIEASFEMMSSRYRMSLCRQVVSIERTQ